MAKSDSFDSLEEVMHLIDKYRSIELASGHFKVIQLKQGGNVVAALTRVSDAIQWPLARDEAAFKLEDTHYFFSLRVPTENG